MTDPALPDALCRRRQDDRRLSLVSERTHLRLVAAPDSGDAVAQRPTTAEMIEMVGSPGLIRDHPLWPKLQRHLAMKQPASTPTRFSVIDGGAA
jgi:hypothetical protein